MSVLLGDLLQFVDILFCAVIFGLSGLLALAKDARTLRNSVLTIGLIGGVVGCFIGMVVVYHTGHRAPWAVAQRFSHACLLVWVWDRTYGFARQAGMVRAWALALPARLRDAYARWRWS